MIEGLIAGLLVAAISTAAAVLVSLTATRDRTVRSRYRRRALVTLKNGDTFDGVLFEADRQAVVLRNASQVGVANQAGPVPVDGEVLILLEDVVVIQLP